MLASLTPSVELTGGPWYSDQDLDTVFIDMVLKVAKKYLINEVRGIILSPLRRSLTGGQSFPKRKNSAGDRSQAPLLYPTCHTPLLPTAEDVLDFVRESGAFTGVELHVEHMETLLDILVYDGFCEKIDVLRPNVDGLFDDDDDDTDSEAEPSRGWTKGKSTQRPTKRSRLDSDAEESAGEGDDLELPPPLDDKRKPSVSGATTSKRDRLRKRPPTYVVYRCIPDYKGSLGLRVGLTDAPCGVCPVSHLCENRGRPKVMDSPAPVAMVSSFGKQKRQRDWIRMRAPGGDDMGHAGDGRWRGGGSKNDTEVPGPINPINCAPLHACPLPMDC
jgi:DNA-directed RNA polymerase III subunit RPC6